MKTLKRELREFACLASLVTGLSVLGVGLAVALVIVLERLPVGITL
jgi:hypothetical protein